MPQPTPNDGETHDDWIDRCMSNPTMKDEYGEDDQRLAVCQSIWDDKDKASAEPEGKAASKPERLALDRALAEVRAVKRVETDDMPHEIRGYAAVFYNGKPETEFKLFDDMIERIMPGAFDDVLANKPDVRGLFNHDPDHVLGRTSAGTMTLSVDDKGLAYRIMLGDTNIARDVGKHVERGDIDGSSFAFQVQSQEFRTEDGIDIREITKVEPLFDVGPVTFPAYEGTAAGFRATEDIAREVRAAVAKADTTQPPAKPSSTSEGKKKWRHGWRPRSSEDAETRELRKWAENLT
jgi:HK97 family phage prohead protease